MAYDQSKDKLLKMFELKQDKSGVLFSIFSYDGSKPKLGLTRIYEKKDGTMGYGQIGRLTIEEVKFLKENIDRIIEVMEIQK